MKFNEYNDVAFHHLSRSEEYTSVHNLTSLLGLCPKFCPKIIKRLRKDIRIRQFILNNVHADETEKAPKLYRNNIKWDPEKASGPLEGAVNRLEQVLKVEFGSLRKKASSNLEKAQKISLD